jgi:hypothetical protein
MHINPEFVRRGPIDPKQFFVRVDLTNQAAHLAQQVEDKLGDFSQLIQRSNHPDVGIGAQCDDPYTCPLHEMCWGFLPENSVLTLHRGAKKGFSLLEGGITRLKDIPDSASLTDHQETQRRVLRTGQPHIDKPSLQAFLGQLAYPVSYLDFETFGTAIPLFDALRPYQQVPFQFSLHIVRSPGAGPEHHQFLVKARADPRPEFMHCLREALPEAGSIVIYNAAFETRRLEECSELLTEYRPWLRRVQKRVVDLLLPFRAFHYYHPSQAGSASMKAVLPALTGKGYGHLAIQEGDTASREFLRVTFGEVSAEERQRVWNQLEEYCGLDTLGMAQIVQTLQRLAAR